VHRVEYSNFSAPCGTVLSNFISHCERAHEAVNAAVFKRARRKRNHMFDIMNSSSSEIKDHSQNHGYDLKDVQLRAIESILSSKDTIVVAKTGYGKSLIFQVAISLINSTGVGTAVIVSPLVALMVDQCTAASRWGPSVVLGSAQTDQQAQTRLEAYRYIFLSPEKLMQGGIQRELKRISQFISMIVIDECHCQIVWKDFRDAFAALPSTIAEVFGDNRPPLLLMTATLPVHQQTQLSQEFRLGVKTQVFRASCDRENLSIQIMNSDSKTDQILELCQKSKSKGNMTLIYVATPQECKGLLASLQGQHTDLRIAKYHGAGSKGSSTMEQDLEERKQTLLLATSKRLDVIICTSAFGMGIDIPHIDTVIHVVPPRSLSEFAQQIGRAGRSGAPATAVTLFHCSLVSHCFSLWISNKNVSVMEKNFAEFQDMVAFIYSAKCRRKFVRYMIENIAENEPLSNECNCDNCIDEHIVQRDVAPAMHMLLSAFNYFGSPVCITRVADLLFAHVPKHKVTWCDKQAPLWGLGATLFRPTKQAQIWSSLAAVALYELQYLQATLCHHVAPTGNTVAYQRLSLTAKGHTFLASTGPLLVRERFVPKSAWEVISARCSVDECKNKATGSASLCSKHSKKAGASTQPSSDKGSVPTMCQQFTSQQLVLPPSSQLGNTEFTSQPDKSATQCTPAGFMTQDRQGQVEHSSHLSSQVKSMDPSTPSQLPPKFHVTTFERCAISKKGTYEFDESENPDASYNPYMGDTWTRFDERTGIKTKVRPFLNRIVTISENS
jgi:RecQ family ATP-dependent DNA helicase